MLPQNKTNQQNQTQAKIDTTIDFGTWEPQIVNELFEHKMNDSRRALSINKAAIVFKDNSNVICAKKTTQNVKNILKKMGGPTCASEIRWHNSIELKELVGSIKSKQLITFIHMHLDA